MRKAPLNRSGNGELEFKAHSSPHSRSHAGRGAAGAQAK
jgi:hypothetical protein